MILLDTCVVNEVVRPEPSEQVQSWLASLDECGVYLPALVLGEIRQGIELLALGNSRAVLATRNGADFAPARVVVFNPW